MKNGVTTFISGTHIVACTPGFLQVGFLHFVANVISSGIGGGGPSYRHCCQGPHRQDGVDECRGRENVKVVRRFGELKADLNAKAKNGRTALMYAANNKHYQAVECLVCQLNAEVFARDAGGKSAQDYANLFLPTYSSP